MLTLAKHIETLLVKHNCVVIPGLGGFVTQHQDAYYNEEEGCFYPPMRRVTFNALLSINDGLLMERYQRHDGLSYYEASRLLNEHVDNLKQTIQTDGSVELIGIGTLAANSEGGINFTPREDGIMTPELYGLDSVFARKVEAQPATLKTQNTDDDSKYYVIRINRNAAKYVAAAILAVLFYFLAIPTGNPLDTTERMASVVPTQVHKQVTVHKRVVVKHQTASTPAATAPTPQPAMPEEVKAEAAPATAAPATPKIEQKAAPQPVAADKYAVVLASAVSRAYAEEYVKKLQAKGMTSARIMDTGTMRRVVVGHFATEEEGRNYIRILNNDEQFADCWLLKL